MENMKYSADGISIGKQCVLFLKIGLYDLDDSHIPSRVYPALFFQYTLQAYIGPCQSNPSLSF
jgi:hypothetical protein